jgi:hypothetical protein
MNPNQFTTFDEASQIAAQLSSIGGGVQEVYEAEMQLTNAAIGDSKFYHFRFHNGTDGVNAGLVREMMKTNPSRWPLMLAAEVGPAKK